MPCLYGLLHSTRIQPLAGSEISIVFLEILSLDEGTNGGAVEIMGDFPLMLSQSKHS
jgi:hypothetical protein